MRHPRGGAARVRCGGAGRARGAILLEVLVSIALLVFGLSVVGMQVNSGLEAARQAEIGTKAVMLADTKMAELLAGVIQPEANNDEVMGDFGMVYPGYTWRFQFEPTDVPDFLMVTLEIGYSAVQARDQQSRPDQDLRFDDAEVRVVETAYRLIPIPADVNLERDFGLTQEELDKLNEIAGGQSVGAEGAAGENAQAAAEGAGGQAPEGLGDILSMLGPLLSGGSFDPRMLASLPPDTLAQLQPLLEGLLGRGNVGAQGPPGASELARQVFGGRRGGRRGGRDRDGNRGGSDSRGGGRDGDDAGGRDEGRGDDANGRGGRGRDDDRGGRGGRGGRDRDEDNTGRDGGRRDDDRGGRDDAGPSGENQPDRNGNDQGRRGGSRGGSRTTR